MNRFANHDVCNLLTTVVGRRSSQRDRNEYRIYDDAKLITRMRIYRREYVRTDLLVYFLERNSSELSACTGISSSRLLRNLERQDAQLVCSLLFSIKNPIVLPLLASNIQQLLKKLKQHLKYLQ